MIPSSCLDSVLTVDIYVINVYSVYTTMSNKLSLVNSSYDYVYSEVPGILPMTLSITFSLKQSNIHQ